MRHVSRGETSTADGVEWRVVDLTAAAFVVRILSESDQTPGGSSERSSMAPRGEVPVQTRVELRRSTRWPARVVACGLLLALIAEASLRARSTPSTSTPRELCGSELRCREVMDD